MSAPMRFRKVGALGRGYDVGQVDAFIARALGGGVSSAEIRSVGFDLRLGGYQVSSVDAALDRLEDDALNAEREGD
ncbi:MAG TPA: DivIVA domain-containing protein, partial [Angustibacter sp.]|nr:DivIVA domain-containing protein [Angustibacter sp.]